MIEYVYFAAHPTDDVMKIGKSRDPERRVAALKMRPIRITSSITERQAHARFAAHRLPGVGELFRMSPIIEEALALPHDPPPRDTVSFTVIMPKSLRRQLRIDSARRGVKLGDYVVSLLAASAASGGGT